MATELNEQIRELIDGGTAPVPFAEIAAGARGAPAAPRSGLAPSAGRRPRPWRGPGPRLRPGRRRRPRTGLMPRVAWPAAALAVTAAATVVTVAVTQAGGAPARPSGAQGGVLLTAAQVRQVAVASTTALAHSARALISYGGTGPVPITQTETVAFSGKDYAIAGQLVGPDPNGQPARGRTFTDRFAERFISGQVYVRWPGPSGPGHWIRYTGAIPALHIPDPRKLLGVLRPVERFRFAGYVTVGGVRLKRLRATDPVAVPGFDVLENIRPGRDVTAVQVLVDRNDVVRQFDVTLRGKAAFRVPGKPVHHGTEITNMTVAFSAIGQPQAMRVPPHINEHAGPGRHPWPTPVFGIPLTWPLYYTLGL